MSETLGPEWFPRTDEEWERLYETKIGGSVHSSWALLTNCARSSIASAVDHASRILNLWQRGLRGKQNPAELEFLLWINASRSLVGSLMAAILFSALSLESFVRVVAERYWTEKLEEHEQVARKIRDLDGLGFAKRISALLDLTQAGPLCEDLTRQLTALTALRNDLAHDSPILFLANREKLRRKHGKRRRYEPSERYQGLFPGLDEGHLAFSVSHALLAASTHDEIVDQVLSAVSEELDMDSVAPSISQSILGWSAVDHEAQLRIAKAWDEDLLPWIRDISVGDQESFYRDVTRRVNVRVVE